MKIEHDKCYKNSEIVDGENKVIGPMRRAGFLFFDPKGFPYMEDGIFFSISEICYGMPAKPEKNLIEEVPCPIGKV